MAQYLALDIGKSLARAALVDDSGRVLSRESEVSRFAEGGEVIIRQAEATGRRILEQSKEKPLAVGIGVPAFVNPGQGVILASGFIPEWAGFTVRDHFAQWFGLPVAVDNDVRVAAIGEAIHGAGKGKPVVTYATLSTGFGIATVREGQIWRGSHELAGQLGFTKLVGERTANQLLSGSGLLAVGSKFLGPEATPSKLFEAARHGATGPKQLIDDAVEALGRVLALIQTTLDPDLIVLGGSVALGQPDFVRRGIDRSKHFLGAPHQAILAGRLPVVPAGLAENSGLVGAAEIASRVAASRD